MFDYLTGKFFDNGDLSADANSTNITHQLYDRTGFYIGLSLAISSSIFIGSSFIIKKKALNRLSRAGVTTARDGGHGYLKEWIWWAGFFSMAIGEIANFAAYAFAPASLVTPLGALSVLVSAILASKYLDEKINLVGKLGCVLCILGSTIIVIHSPKEEEVESLEQLLQMLQEPLFISYVALVMATSFIFAIYLAPHHGESNVLIYIVICSAIGSLSVMGCKGLGLAIKETITNPIENNAAKNWLTWVLLLSVVLCIMVQMNYLNKALDIFKTTIVTPVYYVFFTTLVIIASAILFKEWQHLSAEDVIGNICGFLIVIIAIFMLNAMRIRLAPKQITVPARAYNELQTDDTESLIPSDDQVIYSSTSRPIFSR